MSPCVQHCGVQTWIYLTALHLSHPPIHSFTDGRGSHSRYQLLIRSNSGFSISDMQPGIRTSGLTDYWTTHSASRATSQLSIEWMIRQRIPKYRKKNLQEREWKARNKRRLQIKVGLLASAGSVPPTSLLLSMLRRHESSTAAPKRRVNKPQTIIEILIGLFTPKHLRIMWSKQRGKRNGNCLLSGPVIFNKGCLTPPLPQTSPWREAALPKYNHSLICSTVPLIRTTHWIWDGSSLTFTKRRHQHWRGLVREPR